MYLSQPKFYTLLGLSSLIILLWGCAKAPQTVILKGQIKNTKATEISLSNYDQEFQIALDSTQSFIDTLAIEAGFYDLRAGYEFVRLYVTPGQVIELEADAESFDESLSFKDNENQLLIDNFLLKEKMQGGGAKEYYSLAPKAYKARVDSIAQTQLDQLNQAEVSPAFKALETKEINYTQMWALQQYEMAHKYYTQAEEVRLPENFKTVLEGLHYDSGEDFKNHQAYRSLVYNQAWNLEDSTDLGLIDHIRKNNSLVIQEALMKHVLNYRLSPATENSDLILEFVREVSQDSAFRADIETKYDKIQKILKGKEAPVFENYENYAGGTTSLTDLRGKYVYIDVWATWCGPCKYEIPYLKKVEHEFKDRNIHFVSVSIDNKKDHQAWRDMVQEKELGGIQLFAEGAWKSSIAKDYAIDGIPRFILIDPDGKIVNADAPRPSEPKLRSKLKKLLK